MLRKLIRAVRGQIMPARENQYACDDLSVYKKIQLAAKIHICPVKTFLPKHNLPGREKNSLEQAAFWHEVKVVCY